MYPPPDQLHTESDVEQKLVFPLLISSAPDGLEFSTSDFVTKLSTRRIEIGKGTARKLYYPDYLVVLAGMPVMVIEAKAVGESVENGLDEARLYANEINALFPHNINPCTRVIACNGEWLLSAPVDTAQPDVRLGATEMNPANIGFARFIELCSRSTLQKQVDLIRSRMKPVSFRRPISLVGGATFQNEELPQNTFGATIAGDYGHIFNPKDRDDRIRIVREAYIPSLRQQRYVEPIDRLVRNAVAPVAGKIKPLQDSSKPIEITVALRDRRKLENQVLLLVGSVGAGKSTFVDYLSHVALPVEIREKTVWLRIDLNEAPLSPELAYEWIARAAIEELRANRPSIDFDDNQVLQKIFHRELNALKKGPLAILDETSTEYKIRIADRLMQLQSSAIVMAKGVAEYVCSASSSLLVIVLDNCDKRTRDEQLMMFQIAQWVQGEFRCLVVLPLRDITFDLHRNDKPLDTALKQFVFRIEPPPFSDVLQARVKLALDEISRSSQSASTFSYQLPNGMKVTYSAEDQALYLASILRSLYAHDRFVRQVMTGLAGRNIRLALEIFLDFCMSGHIGEDEIFKIRFLEGKHVLPLSIVARVLLRMQRRFYDGNRSYLKNIVQCDPDDSMPDHFVRLAILHWLEGKLKARGPAGVEGFHRVENMIADLTAVGHDSGRVREELGYLAREGCVIPEHLKLDKIEDSDLVKISAAGVVHIQLLVNAEYLAACAEDTWIADIGLSKRIADRLSNIETQFTYTTTTRTAAEFVEYLKTRWAAAVSAPEVFLHEGKTKELQLLREAEAGVAAAEIALPEKLYVGGVDYKTTEPELRQFFADNGITTKGIILPQSNGRNRGFAFIEPVSKAEVLAALEMDGKIRLRGRQLRISEAHPTDEDQFKNGGYERPIPALSTRVYIGNLAYSCDSADVRALLADNDLTAIDIYLPMDKTTNKIRGFCMVEFGTLDDAARAIGALSGVEFYSRILVVRPADARG